MVSKSFQYLEAAKIEELARRYESEGYEVRIEPDGRDAGFDLVARKNGDVIAVEVKAKVALKSAQTRIEELRERAHQLGYGFRLVIFSPPHAPSIEVVGLEDALRDHLVEHIPDEVQALATSVRIDGVRDVEITSLTIDNDRIEVQGAAALELELEFGGGVARDGLSAHDSYPCRFHVILDSSLTVKEVAGLHVDVLSESDDASTD